jgi:hypothetical protein
VRSRGWMVSLCGVLLLLSSSPASIALEKTVARMADDEHAQSPWSFQTTMTLAYYNTCTGWIWVWSGWQPEDRVGVHFTDGLWTVHLAVLWTYVAVGCPYGYGFTGTIDLFHADANSCPSGAPLASQPFLPASGWNPVLWTELSFNEGIAAYTLGAGTGNPLGLASDYPPTGPTGPPACGTCYPAGRTGQSFYYGTPASPLCPGSPFHGGTDCDAELIWELFLVGDDSTGVHAGEGEFEWRSWSAVKGLYR